MLILLSSTVVLARLLTPADFGLVGMATTLTAFVMVFREVGLSTATIQQSSISSAQVSALFWINCAVGLLLTLTTIALARPLALFFGDDRVFSTTLLLSPVFVLNGLACQHQALLKREMRFQRLAIIDLVSAALGATVAVAVAYVGAGYHALILQQLTVGVCACGLSWILSPWRPELTLARRQLKHLLHFGSHIAGFDIVNYFSRNLDNVLVGRVWGAEALGFYSKAYQLFLVPIAQLRGPLALVALPALSRLQDDREAFASYYKSFLSTLALLTMPLAAVLFALADSLVLLILGPKWLASAAILKILAIGGLIQGVATTRGVVMTAAGKSKRYFWFGCVRSAYTSLSFLLGIPWGAAGVATAYVLCDYVALVPTLAYSFRGTPVRVADFFASVAPAAIATGAMLCVMKTIQVTIAPGHIDLVVTGMAGVAAYILALVIQPEGKRMLKTMWRAVEGALTRRQVPA